LMMTLAVAEAADRSKPRLTMARCLEIMDDFELKKVNEASRTHHAVREPTRFSG
jgi:hypothetical protein